MAKIYAVEGRLQRICGSISAQPHASAMHLEEDLIPERAAIFVADCTIGIRRQMFDQLLRGKASCLLDVRASGEAFECFCLSRDLPEVMPAYS